MPPPPGLPAAHPGVPPGSGAARVRLGCGSGAGWTPNPGFDCPTRASRGLGVQRGFHRVRPYPTSDSPPHRRLGEPQVEARRRGGVQPRFQLSNPSNPKAPPRRKGHHAHPRLPQHPSPPRPPLTATKSQQQRGAQEVPNPHNPQIVLGVRLGSGPGGHPPQSGQPPPPQTTGTPGSPGRPALRRTPGRCTQPPARRGYAAGEPPGNRHNPTPILPNGEQEGGG